MTTEEGLRRGLFALVSLGAGGLLGELGLIGHWESPPQVLPFVLALMAALVGLAGATRTVPTWPARVAFGLCVLGGGFGVFEHLEHNWEFAAEIDATATSSTLLVEALTGGSPALAPGALGWLGALGLLATWRSR